GVVAELFAGAAQEPALRLAARLRWTIVAGPFEQRGNDAIELPLEAIRAADSHQDAREGQPGVGIGAGLLARERGRHRRTDDPLQRFLRIAQLGAFALLALHRKLD